MKYCVLLFDQFHTKLSLTSHLENTLFFFLDVTDLHLWGLAINFTATISGNQLQLEYIFFFLQSVVARRSVIGL